MPDGMTDPEPKPAEWKPQWEFADFPYVEPVSFYPGMELTADTFHKLMSYQAALVASMAPPSGLRADDRGIIDGKWGGDSGGLTLGGCTLRTNRGFHLKVLGDPAPPKTDPQWKGEEFKVWFGYDATMSPQIQTTPAGDRKPDNTLRTDLGFTQFKKGKTSSRRWVAELASARADESWAEEMSERFLGLVRFYHETRYLPLPPADINRHELARGPGVDVTENYPKFDAIERSLALDSLLRGGGPISFSALYDATVALVSSITRVPIPPVPAEGRHYPTAIDAAVNRIPAEYQDYQRVFTHVREKLADREPRGSFTCQAYYVRAADVTKLPTEAGTTLLVYPTVSGVKFGAERKAYAEEKLPDSQSYSFFAVGNKVVSFTNDTRGAPGDTVVLRLLMNYQPETAEKLKELIKDIG